MTNKKNRSLRLQKILSSGKRLLIFNHFNPDPDSITAAFILAEIARSFKIKSKIVYSGKISYSKNLAMIIYLKIDIQQYKQGEEKKYDLIASVDTQKGMSNNAIPENVFPHLTFDHHPRVPSKRSPGEKRLMDIRTRYGSAASILLEYYLELGLPWTARIATSYCYAIAAETNYFTQKYNEIDVVFYRKAVQYADLRLIAKIESTKRPVIYFKVLTQVINTHKRKGNLLTCNLGEISNLEFLHELANFMLTMDGVDFVAITGIHEGMRKICCRSNNFDVHLGNILRASLQGIGSGGGHETMAAGEFRVKEEQVLKKFKSYLEKFDVLKPIL